MTAALDRILALWERTPPRLRRAIALLLALLACWGAALAVANRPAARARLRATLRDAAARRLPGAEVGDQLSIDPLFRVHFGPLTVRGERPGAPPVLRADGVQVRASLGALLLGRLEPASIRLYGVRIEPGERFVELRGLLERLRHRPEAKAGSAEAERPVARGWPAIHLRGAILALRRGGSTLEVGPLDASLLRRRSGDEEELDAVVTHRAGGAVRLSLHRGADGLRLRASALDLGPEIVPAPLLDGPVRWNGGTLSADLSLTGRAGEPAHGRVRARIEQVWFAGDRLAPEPVGPITAELDGEVEADPGARRVALREAGIRALGALEGTISAELRIGAGLPFSLELAFPAVEYDVLAEALPAPLRPPAEAPHPAGPFSFRLAVAGPLREPAAWTVDAALDLSRLREAARAAPPVALRSSFTWSPEVESGEPPAIRVGPESPDWVALADLPEHVVRAVTTSEDAGFYGHPGFDFAELRNAFAQGAEAGRVVRGASTITQQLAKNLYLSREKTLVRKGREAMVSVALEATVPKARLLEIYLNIAEWGPGIWGIGPAARHYFAKPARDLTPREAAFLASIIPNPVRYHGYFTRGELDEAWTERLRTLLLHMAEAGVLTEEQLVAALDAPLAFANGATAATAEPSEESPVPPTLSPAAEAGTGP